MLYEMIGVVSPRLQRAHDALANPPLGAPRPPLRSQRVNTHLTTSPAPPLPRSPSPQNRKDRRQNRPREERRRPRRHQLGHFLAAQAREEAAVVAPRRPPLHHALRCQRPHTALAAAHHEFGSAVDSVLDCEDGDQV